MSYTVLFLTFCCSILPAFGIIGGKPAGNHPYFVLAVRGQSFDQICGGLIVSRNVVLTSASCLYYHEQKRWSYAEELYVIHGNFSIPNDWGGKSFEVEDYIFHLKYAPAVNKVPVPYDIAMIKLRHTIQFNGKALGICKKKNYSHGLFIGLGVNRQNPYQYPLQLKEATLLADEACGSYNYWFHMNRDLQMCYHDPQRKYACHGDLGGPLLFHYKDESLCIIGIASYHYQQCDNSNYPAVFTNAPRLKNWINRQKKYFNL